MSQLTGLPEPGGDGTLLRISRRVGPDEQQRTYTYAALRAVGRWYVTQSPAWPVSPMTWPELLAWAEAEGPATIEVAIALADAGNPDPLGLIHGPLLMRNAAQPGGAAAPRTYQRCQHRHAPKPPDPIECPACALKAASTNALPSGVFATAPIADGWYGGQHPDGP